MDVLSQLDADSFTSGARMTAPTYIRVVSLAIAFYDWILTLPAEWRFYTSQRSWRLSPGCILFIAIRYSSIAVLITSNIGYFGNFFTPESCHRYYIVPAVFKVVQAMVSQLILGIRTINISRRSTWVTWTIAISFVLSITAEWFLNTWNRVPLMPRGVNCAAGNRPPKLTVWLYYIFVISYDLITLGISTVYLVSFGPNSGKMAHLIRIMLTDGLIYFAALSAVNILNLILYRSTDETDQSSGVNLGYALTWIMSQRILIHLRDAAAAHNRTITTQVVVSRQLPSAVSISQAMRSQFETKDRDRLSSMFDLEWTSTSAGAARADIADVGHAGKSRASGSRVRDVERGEGKSRSEGSKDGSEFELDVRVQIEETVTVEYDPEAYERESYRTPRVKWRRKGREGKRQDGREQENQNQSLNQVERPKGGSSRKSKNNSNGWEEHTGIT